MTIPERCNVIDVFYTGDEGGIICCLDIGGPQTQNANLVSITHLGFHRNTPLSREIDLLRISSNRTPADTNSLPAMGLVRARDATPCHSSSRERPASAIAVNSHQ